MARSSGGSSPTALHQKWLANAERHGVSPDVIAEITRRQHVGPESFTVLATMTEINDPDGKSFMLLPPGISAEDARRAVLMTYIVNAGTGYGSAGGSRADFPATPYSASEVRRIVDRQQANRWSYAGVPALRNAGGALVTTPNGMLMGLGGNWIHGQFSQRGGTTYGDIFLVNLDHRLGPAWQLRAIVESGRMWFRGDGTPIKGGRDLDRVLHHEERHCQQWARRGPVGMSAGYLAEEARVRIFGGMNRFEDDAGLADGGYR